MPRKAANLTAREIVEEMRKAALEGAESRRLSGAPETDREKFEREQAILRIIDEGGIRFACIGCGLDLTVDQAAPCTCGGFVCVDCAPPEGETCTHEIPPEYGDPEDDQALPTPGPDPVPGEKRRAVHLEGDGHSADVYLVHGEPRGEVVLYRDGQDEPILTHPLGLDEIAIFAARRGDLIEALMDRLIKAASHPEKEN